MDPLLVPREAVASLAVPEGFDDPVMLAVFDGPPVEAAAEGAFTELPAAVGLAEAETVSIDPGLAVTPLPVSLMSLLLWLLPCRRCINPSRFRTEGGQGHAEANDV